MPKVSHLGHLVPGAQSLGWQLTKKEAIVPGHPAKLPNAKVSCDRCDGCHRRISGFERLTNQVESSAVQISDRRYAEMPMKRIAQRPLRDPSSTGELFQCQKLSFMLVDEILGPANNLLSRDRMPAKSGYGFVRRAKHIADLTNKLLRRCFLPSR